MKNRILFRSSSVIIGGRTTEQLPKAVQSLQGLQAHGAQVSHVLHAEDEHVETENSQGGHKEPKSQGTHNVVPEGVKE